MPGRHRWRWRGEKPCPRRIYRFLEPCLLLLLHQKDAHGYELLRDLDAFGFQEGPIDSSVVYRTLRDMEARGWVISDWDTGGSGPPRRIYRLAPEGDQALASWIKVLQETRKVLGRFLTAYEEHVREGKGSYHESDRS